MHPIHYSLVLGVMTIGGGTLIALVFSNPLIFVVAALITYLLGAQMVGRFSGQDELGNTPPDDYQGTAAGFHADQ